MSQQRTAFAKIPDSRKPQVNVGQASCVVTMVDGTTYNLTVEGTFRPATTMEAFDGVIPIKDAKVVSGMARLENMLRNARALLGPLDNGIYISTANIRTIDQFQEDNYYVVKNDVHIKEDDF